MAEKYGVVTALQPGAAEPDADQSEPGKPVRCPACGTVLCGVQGIDAAQDLSDETEHSPYHESSAAVKTVERLAVSERNDTATVRCPTCGTAPFER